MKAKEKKESAFLTKLFTGVSFIYILLGGLLCTIPSLKMEYICYGISVTLIILGIIFIVKYFITDSYKNLNQYGFSIGVFLVIIGTCTLVKNAQLTKNFQLYIGVCILLTAIIKLQNAMDLKALKDRVWSVICGVSVLIMIAAMVIIINPFSNSNYEIALTYFSLLFDGMISIFSYNYLSFRLKKAKRQQVIAELAKNQSNDISTDADMNNEPDNQQEDEGKEIKEQDSCTM